MCPQIQLIPGAVSAILASATETGTLTKSDRYGLLAACLDDSLCEDERRAIDRLLRSVVKGKVQVA